MTPTTSQAVQEAREAVYLKLVDARSKMEANRITKEAFDTYEAAVRTDEAAGLVDILARLVEGTLSNDDIECWWCGGYGRYSLTKDDEFEFAYLDHTPDCPWVEGMIAVAERLGQ